MDYSKFDKIDLVRITEGILDFSEICREETAKAGRLVETLETKAMTVAIIGQFKRGKSSLINRMLGDEVLPVGIVPITSVVTRIISGEDGAVVSFKNGLIRPTLREDLSYYISEQSNPDNKEGVDSVTISLKDPFVDEGITIVDTPGVGSIHKHNTTAAYDFVKESDGVVFMLSVDSPINEIEIDFLKNAQEYAGRFYFAVNKVDVIEEEELKTYLSYCRTLLSAIMNMPKKEVRLFPVSAKRGTGVEELKNYILEDCRKKSDEILEKSIDKKLIDVIDSGLLRMSVYWSATRMSRGNFDFHYNKMKEGIEEAKIKYFGALAVQGTNCRKSELVAKLNMMKDQIMQAINNEFEIDYYYEHEEAVITDEEEFCSSKTVEEYRRRGEEICEELEKTLNVLLMYREDDSIVVAKRIKHLKRIRIILKEIRTTIAG